MSGAGALVINSSSDTFLPLESAISGLSLSLTPPPQSSSTHAFIDSVTESQLSGFAGDFRETLKEADIQKFNFPPPHFLPPVNAKMLPGASAAFLKL